jgi:hypothetical protein
VVMASASTIGKWGERRRIMAVSRTGQGARGARGLPGCKRLISGNGVDALAG